MLSPAAYFRFHRISRIEYLLRPERAALRGCFYMFAKFWISFFIFGTGCNVLFTLPALQLALSGGLYVYLSGALALIVSIFTLMLIVIGIDILDLIWRRREKTDFDKTQWHIRDILRVYQKSHGLSQYNKEVVGHILKIQDDDLSTRLGDMSAKQRALIEDSILYTYEMNGIPNALAYGTKIMILALIVIVVLTFVTLYSFAEHFIRAQFGSNSSGFIMLYVAFAIGIFSTYIGMRDTEKYWNIIGPHGRNGMRRIVFYWPATFPILFGLIYWVQSLMGWR